MSGFSKCLAMVVALNHHAWVKATSLHSSKGEDFFYITTDETLTGVDDSHKKACDLNVPSASMQHPRWDQQSHLLTYALHHHNCLSPVHFHPILSTWE